MDNQMEMENCTQIDNNEGILNMILCPFCKKTIPILSLIEANEELFFGIKCVCLQEEKEISLNDFIKEISKIIILTKGNDHIQGDLFCLKCNGCNCKGCYEMSLNHYIINNDIKVFCDCHNLHFTSYCKNCNINLCSTCLKLHLQHQCAEIGNIDLSLVRNNYNIIDGIIKRTETYVEVFLKRFEGTNLELKGNKNDLGTMGEDIQNSFVRFCSINKNLRRFYLSFFHTAMAMKNCPYYQIMSILKSFPINDNKPTDRGDGIEQTFRSLKEYLASNYVFLPKYKCIATLSDHTLAVWCLALLSNNLLASGSFDKTIKLWNVTTYECTNTLNGHDNSIFCLMSFEDDQLISCSGDRTIKIWNTGLSKCNTSLTGHRDWIYCMIKLKNKKFVSGEYDGSINIWNPRTFQCIDLFKGHKEPVCSLVELSNGNLASGSRDMTIRIWDFNKNSCIKDFHAHDGAVCCLVILNDDRLVSGSADNLIKIWDPESFNLILTLDLHKNTVWCLVVLYYNRLASSSDDRTIKIWDTITFNCLSSMKGHSGGITSLIQLNDNQLASGSRDNTIKIWNI